jgi:hypothetical protein
MYPAARDGRPNGSRRYCNDATTAGHGRLELTKFYTPPATTAEPNAPANTLGLRRVTFALDDVDDAVPAYARMTPDLSVGWRSTRTSASHRKIRPSLSRNTGRSGEDLTTVPTNVR